MERAVEGEVNKVFGRSSVFGRVAKHTLALSTYTRARAKPFYRHTIVYSTTPFLADITQGQLVLLAVEGGSLSILARSDKGDDRATEAAWWASIEIVISL